MNHESEKKFSPIDEAQLTYHKRNYLVASPSKNETCFTKKSQHFGKTKGYAMKPSYVQTLSPIFSTESLKANTISPLRNVYATEPASTTILSRKNEAPPVQLSGHSQIFDPMKLSATAYNSLQSTDRTKIQEM